MSDSVTARWERKKLGEIGEFLNGINKSKNDFGFGVPFVNLMDVFGRTLLDKEPAGLVNASLPEVERYSVKEGDVLFVRSSVKPEGVGLTTVVDRDIPDTVYSGFIIRFRQNALIKAYARYCFHAESFRKSLLAKSTVSANTNVNQVVLSGLEIDIPSVREQQKIATILTTVDQLIEKTQTLIDKYITIKQGMMADLFTRGIDLTPGADGRPESNPNYGQLRPPREQAPELYKETELGWVPKEWEVAQLKGFGDWGGGMTPSKARMDYWRDGKHLWISPKDVRGDRITSSEDKLADAALSETTLKRFPEDSVLIVFRSGILRNKVPIARPIKAFTVNQDIKVLVSFPENDSSFCFYLLKSREQMILRTYVKSGTTVESIDGESFFKMVCPRPSKSEQARISGCLRVYEQLIEKEEHLIRKYREQKKALMQDLLTGKVQVQV